MKTEQSPRQTSGKLDHLLNSQPKGMPSQLHKYVWGGVGILGLFFVSFPIACARVAHSESFEKQQQPLNSIAWDDNEKDNLVYPEPK
jgi:hypothetical protein